MRIVLGLVVVSVLLAGGAAGVAYTGWVDVSATTEEPEILRWLLQTTRERSVRRRAEGIPVPDLAPKDQIAAGARAFAEMCMSCHGGPGSAPVLGAREMNPAPPDLVTVAEGRSPAEIFWVIKNGIRMTGMPAWGPTHSDDQLWELVAFIKELPRLSEDDYRELVAHSGESGHRHDHGGSVQSNSPGHEHGHGGHDG